MTEAITAFAIEQTLREKLSPTLLEVFDESAAHAGHAGANGTGFGTHFRIRITAPVFTGKRLVARHRVVYDALQVYFDRGLHAVKIEVI